MQPEGSKTPFRPSIITVSVGIFVIAIAIVCSSTLAISISLSLRGAKTLAENLVLGVTESNIAQVQSILSYPVQAADMLQFKVLGRSSVVLPTEEVADHGIKAASSNSSMSGQDTWADEWTSIALAFAKGSGFTIRGTSVGFVDGSSATCLNVPNVEGEVVVTAFNPYGFAPTGVNSDGFPTYNLTDIPTSRVFYYVNGSIARQDTVWGVSADLRTRPWYVSSPKESPLQKQWSSVSMSFRTSASPPTPVISLSSPLFNRSGTFLGVAWFTLALDVIDTKMKLAEQAAAVERSHSILLDGDLRIVASSLPQASYTFTAVPPDYNLTDSEALSGCLISDNGLFCPHTIGSFGFKPLTDLLDRRPDVFDISFTDTIRVKLDGEIYFARVIVILGDVNSWQMVSLIPERGVTKAIDDGRNIAIGVTIGLIFLGGILVSLFIRSLFRPLADIAKWLETGAYLTKDEETSEAYSSRTEVAFSPSEQSHRNNMISAVLPPQPKKKKPRAPQTLSRLSDVAAIQKAYWEMAGELKALRGYIPEHICRELVSQPSRAKNQTSQAIISPDDSTSFMGVTTNGGALVGDGGGAGRAASARSSSGRGRRATPSGAAGGPGHTYETLDTANDIEMTTDGGVPLAFANLQRHEVLTGTVRSPVDRLPSPAGMIALPIGGHEGQLPTSIQQQQGPLLCHNGVNEEVGHDEVHDDRNSSRRMDSLEDPSEVAVRQGFVSSPNGQLANNANTPIYFRDNLLVDRDVAIAVINVVGFHQYAQVTHGTDVTKDHQVLVSYVHEAARRCGGVLDTFSGDKFWVSFNATTKCVNGLIAATAFALEVVTTINREAAIAQRARRSDYERKYKNLPPLPSAPIRFRAALRGVTAGVAAGRAFVGPLGTDSVRRHTIISGAMSEAAALERMALRYPGSGLVVGGDTIPSIEGYFQYLLLDASLLPGSGGLRRRIATVKAPMCAPGCDPSVLRGLADGPLSTNNPFAPINGCFNAFLEGRMRECAQLLDAIDRVVAHDLLVSAGVDPRTGLRMCEPQSRPAPTVDAPYADIDRIQAEKKAMGAADSLSRAQAMDISVMLRFVWSLTNGSEENDGRLYRCKLGDVHLPVEQGKGPTIG